MRRSICFRRFDVDLMNSGANSRYLFFLNGQEWGLGEDIFRDFGRVFVGLSLRGNLVERKLCPRMEVVDFSRSLYGQ